MLFLSALLLKTLWSLYCLYSMQPFQIGFFHLVICIKVSSMSFHGLIAHFFFFWSTEWYFIVCMYDHLSIPFIRGYQLLPSFGNYEYNSRFMWRLLCGPCIFKVLTCYHCADISVTIWSPMASFWVCPPHFISFPSNHGHISRYQVFVTLDKLPKSPPCILTVLCKSLFYRYKTHR